MDPVHNRKQSRVCAGEKSERVPALLDVEECFAQMDQEPAQFSFAFQAQAFQVRFVVGERLCTGESDIPVCNVQEF